MVTSCHCYIGETMIGIMKSNCSLLSFAIHSTKKTAIAVSTQIDLYLIERISWKHTLTRKHAVMYWIQYNSVYICDSLTGNKKHLKKRKPLKTTEGNSALSKNMSKSSGNQRGDYNYNSNNWAKDPESNTQIMRYR